MPRLGHGSVLTISQIDASAEALADDSRRVPFGFAVSTPADSTQFGYLFPGLQSEPGNLLPEDAATVQDLVTLGRAMRDRAPEDKRNSSIPAAYTYFGQFVDHDITLETASAPLSA